MDARKTLEDKRGALLPDSFIKIVQIKAPRRRVAWHGCLPCGGDLITKVSWKQRIVWFKVCTGVITTSSIALLNTERGVWNAESFVSLAVQGKQNVEHFLCYACLHKYALGVVCAWSRRRGLHFQCLIQISTDWLLVPSIILPELPLKADQQSACSQTSGMI